MKAFRLQLVLATMLMVAVSSLCLAQDAPTMAAPSDPHVLYIGRWDRGDPATYHSYWGGAYLRTIFTGSEVGIRLAGGAGLVVSIDNEQPRVVNGNTGVTDLAINKLKPGTHSLLVGASGQNFEMAFQGLVLSPGATTMSAKKLPLMEFVGDSITTGTGGNGVSTVNWAWETATALGCDHTQIAFSGLSLTSQYGCLPLKVGLDALYFDEKNYNHLSESPQVPWNFSYTPDVIVINLGQNDQCGREPSQTMTGSMIGFVKKIRSHFPDAQFAVLSPFGGAYSKAIQQAVTELTSGGDQRVHFIDTAGWIGTDDTVDGIHPNSTGNVKIIGRLVPLLRPFVPQNPGP